jgi:hypothetical protein
MNNLIVNANKYTSLFVILALQPIGLYFPQPSSGLLASTFSRFLDHTQRRATFGRTPLGGWSVRRRDLNLTTHNTHNSQTYMHPMGFEPTISAGERPKTYASDRTATGTGNKCTTITTKFEHKTH